MTEQIDSEVVKLVLLILTTIFSFLNNRKASATIEQGKEIHTLVNSKMSTALSRIQDLEEEIISLKQSAAAISRLVTKE